MKASCSASQSKHWVNVGYKTNSTNQIAVVPYSFFPHVVVDRGSADPRIFRPSMLVLPQNSTTLANMGVPLGGVLCPLHIPEAVIEGQQTVQQLTESANWKCRCGLYYCSSSILKNDRVYCHSCKIAKVSVQQVHTKLLAKGVIDMVVRHEPTTIYYILVFEVSKATVTGVLYVMLEALRSAVVSILESPVKLVLIGHTATELRMYSFDSDSQELSVVINREFGELTQKLNMVGCAIEHCEAYLNAMIEHIESMNYLFIEPRYDRLADVLATVIQAQPELIKKIIVLSTKGQHNGAYSTGKELVKSNGSFVEQHFESIDNKFKNLGHLVNDSGNNSTMDLFCVVPQGGAVQFEDIKHPFLLSGGSVYLYSANDNTSELYYDVYRCITRLTAFKVEITCFTGVGLRVGSLAYGHYLKHKNKVNLNSLNQDSTIVALFQLCEKQFRTFRTSLQFVVAYFDGRAHRKRIINYSLYRCNNNENHQVMAGFDPQAAARVLLTEAIVYKHRTRNIAMARQLVLDSVNRMREFYLIVNYNVQTMEQNSKAVELSARYSDNMGLFACHVFSLLHRYRGLSVDLCGHSVWRVGLQEIRILTSAVVETSKMLYPRVYELPSSYFSEGNQDDCDPRATIYSDSTAFDTQSVIIVDNGRKIFVYANDQRPEVLQSLFGTSKPSQIESLTHLEPSTQESKALCNFIEQIRLKTRGGCISLQMVATTSKFNRYEEELFVENSYRQSGVDNYVRWMRTHTEQ